MEIKITKKNIKNIRVSASTEALLVSAPKYMSKKAIMKVVEENEEELLKLVERARSKKYINNIEKGEIYLFGELLKGDTLNYLTDELKVENFYREELKKVLENIFEELREITGLKEKSYTVRKMKSRWGTCYPERGLINLNLNLAKRPIDEIKLVVLHELIHLKHPNHSKDFYSELGRYMGNYKEVQRRLKE
ncbi:M48 family peptidase [Anaerosphaera multitolerans]|uniref:M48 family peptidase n=1 Tax=Anaerosphaera multitolerans TaxID=2487351 RepID=A0A437S6S8_9FIRM|nr:M48 family peptidase [Anaerosphaera multitolerans]